MPTIPWIGAAQVSADPAFAMVSRFRLRRRRDVVPFFISALRIHNQMRRSSGILGLSLVARPLRREFLTLSAWDDRESLMAAVLDEPHRRAMERFRAAMDDSTFDYWSLSASELPIPWPTAMARLERGQANTR